MGAGNVRVRVTGSVRVAAGSAGAGKVREKKKKGCGESAGKKREEGSGKLRVMGYFEYFELEN